MHLKYRSVLALTAVLCLLPAAAVAQEGRTNTLSPKAVGSTPQTPDGHPDLTGLWNGLGDNLGGVPNQMYNAGIEVRDDGTTRDVHSGAMIGTWPLPKRDPQNSEQAERAATLLRRMGSNRPIYKPQYWQTVKDFDANSNQDDPSNQCMPAGVPRLGPPEYIGQMPAYLILIYPGPRRPDCDDHKLSHDSYRRAQAHEYRRSRRNVGWRIHRPLGGRHDGDRFHRLQQHQLV